MGFKIFEFSLIILFGIIIALSPRTFMGRAKYDADSLKAERFIKIVGIAIAVISFILLIISIIFHNPNVAEVQ